MNYSLCPLHSPVNCCTFVACLILVFSLNHNVLATSYDMDFEKRPRRYAYIDKGKTHHCKYIDDFALRADCESWSCWESQMRDFTRIEFLHIYNWYRSNVHTGECPGCKHVSMVPVMIQLEWHWWLERESQKAIKKCPVEDFQTNLVIDVRDGTTSGPNFMHCEMVAASFSVQGGTQNELLDMLPLLLNENYLADMDENEVYRRNWASYIGCSYISTIAGPGHTHIRNPPLKGATGHLLCYYCSKEKTLQSNFTSCPEYTTQGADYEFPDLCKSTENKILMPCETKIIPCANSKKSYSWMVNDPFDVAAEFPNGTITLLEISGQAHDDSLGKKSKHEKTVSSAPNSVILTPYVVLLDSYDHKYCMVLILIYTLVLSLMTVTILLIYKSRLLFHASKDR